MWFEILPCAGIIFTAMTLGFYGTHLSPYLLLGTRYFKNLENNDDNRNYLRDMRVTKDHINRYDPYSQVGLECIPDADENPKK